MTRFQISIVNPDCASVNKTIIVSDKGLSPFWHHEIISTNIGLLLIG